MLREVYRIKDEFQVSRNYLDSAEHEAKKSKVDSSKGVPECESA